MANLRIAQPLLQYFQVQLKTYLTLVFLVKFLSGLAKRVVAPRSPACATAYTGGTLTAW